MGSTKATAAIEARFFTFAHVILQCYYTSKPSAEFLPARLTPLAAPILLSLLAVTVRKVCASTLPEFRKRKLKYIRNNIAQSEISGQYLCAPTRVASISCFPKLHQHLAGSSRTRST